MRGAFSTALALWVVSTAAVGEGMLQQERTVALPEPVVDGSMSVEGALAQRRSRREYGSGSLSVDEVGQLLWAAQGVTDRSGLRAAPSAGALYPLELFVVCANVRNLAPGVYHYEAGVHRLVKALSGDFRKALAAAASHQAWIAQAGAVVIFAADYSRTTGKYGDRGRRYVDIEVGHAAENLFLQAESLDLATVVVGAFSDEKVASLLELPPSIDPIVIMPVGKR